MTKAAGTKPAMTKSAKSRPSKQTRKTPSSWLKLGAPPQTPEVKSVFAKSIEKFGYVSFAKEAIAHKPEILVAQEALSRAINLDPKSNLSEIEREIIPVVVSSINQCEGCVMSHAGRLRGLVGDDFWVSRLRVSHKKLPMTKRQRALADFAEKATRTPGAMDAADLDQLRAAGFGETDIIEIASIVAYFNFTNRLNNMLGIVANPESHAANRNAVSD